MAQRTTVVLIDDLDGSEADQTVEFGLDGVTYELDLSEENAAALRDALAEYVSHARRQGRAQRSAGSTRSTTRPRSTSPSESGSSTAEREENRKIRTWAKERGYTVSDRGRLPSEVADAYRADQAGEPAA